MLYVFQVQAASGSGTGHRAASRSHQQCQFGDHLFPHFHVLCYWLLVRAVLHKTTSYEVLVNLIITVHVVHIGSVFNVGKLGSQFLLGWYHFTGPQSIIVHADAHCVSIAFLNSCSAINISPFPVLCSSPY